MFILLVLCVFFLIACSVEGQGKNIVEKDKDVVEIYLVRHGKTIFNTTGQVQGWCDSPLTEEGIELAKKAGKGLKDVKFTNAYSSDMGRARSTAKIIMEENNNNNILEIKELEGLREWGYGGYEGRDDEELWKPLFDEKGIEFKKDWSTWEDFTQVMTDEEIANSIFRNDSMEKAESYSQILERSKKAVEQMVQETLDKDGGKILAVSHGSEIPTILSIFVPEQYAGEAIDNCSLTILKYKNGEYSLEVVGDTLYME